MITAEDLFTEEYEESNDLERIEEPEEDDEQTERRSGDENEAEEEESAKAVVQPKRRVVRNPQPKLNAETLKGKRGLAALESYFDRVRFKGKGHEEQDLNVLLKTYEYWCHRLFPKYPFDDCIAKIEALGTKKAVQTHIKRIRLGMLTDDTPLAPEDQNGSDNEGIEPLADAEPANIFAPLQVPASESRQLSEAQLELIRLNKQKAEKIRQERLAKIRNSAQTSLGESSRLPEPHSSHVQALTCSTPETSQDQTQEGSDFDVPETESVLETPPEEEIELLLDKIQENQNSSLGEIENRDDAEMDRVPLSES